ncbi:PorP/SprF family type IX secretion system membrane protein [Raineya orbicola]|uniref:Bacteroidetes-specific putative membrane protein n=1 Tax=Raineya orbicola TaxID=2016530 RepID=A0A2N3IHH0_9BACT|nr:type IX secretion system membrane protein PorP/SprF [Raineya orbicola]PKQ69744.1 Bacteroidetes-specific putative membrane protein [Raineya orbicola]
MKNLRILSASVYVLLGLKAQAQQDAMFSQYMFNPIAVNPAYVGSNEVLTFTGLFRKQWVGIEGAPTTATLSVDAPLRNETMGLGLNVVGDQIGIFKTLGIYASYSYRIKLNESSRLAFGLQVGGSQFVADFGSVNTINNDPTFQGAGMFSKFLPNVGTGVWYNTERLFVGVSVPHLINNAQSGDAAFLNDTDGARQYRHYFVMAGYAFDLSEDWQLKPSLLFKGVQAAPLQLDINATLWYLDKFGAGLSWRSFSSANILLGYKINEQLSAGYAYDFSTTDLRRYNTGSHELMLRYQLRTSKTRIITPRFF